MCVPTSRKSCGDQSLLNHPLVEQEESKRTVRRLRLGGGFRFRVRTGDNQPRSLRSGGRNCPEIVDRQPPLSEITGSYLGVLGTAAWASGTAPVIAPLAPYHRSSYPLALKTPGSSDEHKGCDPQTPSLDALASSHLQSLSDNRRINGTDLRMQSSHHLPESRILHPPC